MTNAFIYDAVRTPHDEGKKGGALHSVKPVSLTAGLLRAVQRCNDLDTAQVDGIMLDCMTPVGDQGADITKTAALVADWDGQVTGVQINRFCTSGLEAMNLGTMGVRFGFEGLVLVGDVESMSHVLTGSDGDAWALDPETSLHTSFVPQGIGADLITTLEGFSRADVDAFALCSQQKAAKARAEGLFGKSLVPAADQNGVVLLDHDKFIRADSTLEGLAALKPSFEMVGQMSLDTTALRKYGQVERIEYMYTLGNSSGIIDNTSATLTGSEAKSRELGLKARARVVATAVTSTNPAIVFTGPAPATRKAPAKTGLKVEDIGPFEVNEMFVSVMMKFTKNVGIAESKVNVSDSAIVVDHPLSATGCIVLGTLLDELEQRNLHYGLATLYIGGGMGIATITERV